jgi:hypothetical protein
MALGALFIWIGAYFAHKGFTHHGPGWWTFGDDDTGEFSEKLPENRYKRQCYVAVAMFLLIGGATGYSAFKSWRERDKLEESWARFAANPDCIANVKKYPETYGDDFKEWLAQEERL